MVFPDKCLKCGIYIRRNPKIHLSACFCHKCMGGALPEFEPPFCTCCGRLFPSRSGENHICEACIQTPSPVNTVRAAFEYTGLIREAVPLLKYQGRLSLSCHLERYLFEAFCTWYAGQDIHLIIPIPLHRKKAAARGFNQSYMLIRNFKKLYRQRYGVPPAWQIDIRSFARIRYTPSQTGLDIKEREKNLEHAFAWQGGQVLDQKNILLVDDVYTTGSTCKSAASVLKRAGAGSISALVLARA